MWLTLFLLLRLQAGPELDFDTFKAKIEPLLLEKRPGHARCVVCHSTGTAFRLQPLAPGARAWSEAESQKNFEMAKRFVVPGVPMKSRMLTMPLAAEAGGVAFHPGGKHWTTPDDPEWKVLADWVSGKK